jgi:hypothetical protein
MRFHAMVEGGSLWVSFRVSGDTAPSRRMRYDFSANHRSSGLHEVLAPDGRPFPWSPPHVYASPRSCGVMGWIEDAGGAQLFCANDLDADGQIERFNNGNTDGGVDIASQAWGPLDLCDTMRLKQAMKFWLLYVKNGTGVNFVFYRDIGRAEAHTIALPSSGTTLFERLPIELPVAARGNAEGFEWSIQDDGTDGDRLEILRGELEYAETMSEV